LQQFRAIWENKFSELDKVLEDLKDKE